MRAGIVRFRMLVAMLCLVIGAGAGTGVEKNGEVRRFEIPIRDRQVQLESNVLRVNRSDRVELFLTTDEAVRLHLHGYDLEFEVQPGEPAVQTFEAYATGRFPITSHGFGGEHHGHETLLYLEVYPD